MERLTSEQIRLLEELRELRDSGILTVEEFEFQVAKVLGRPQVVEPIPFVEEPLAPEDAAVAENLDEAQQVKQSDVALVPDTSHESELLEYELVEPDISDEDEILVEENQVAEPSSISDTSAFPIAETETQQNNSSRRKVLIRTSVSLVLVAVIALVALVGGGKSDSTSSQIIDSTTAVTQSTMAVSTDEPTTSTGFVSIATTVPGNASTGTGNRPPSATTPVATDSTLSTPSTIVNNVPPIVTNLEISKSSSVFYDYPSDLQQTVTITASILNDESEKPNVEFEVAGVELASIRSEGTWNVFGSFERVQSGTWKITRDVSSLMPYGVVLSGIHTFCIIINGYPPCVGPSATFEVLTQERNPPLISNFTVSPERFFRGDRVRISVRIKDDTGLTYVRGTMCVGNDSGPCGGGDLSLVSGNEKDGLWAFETVVGSEESAEGHCGTSLVVYIEAGGIYSNPDALGFQEYLEIQNVPSGGCSLATSDSS